MPLSQFIRNRLSEQYSATALSVVLCNGLRPQTGSAGGYPGHYLGDDESVIVFNPASDSSSDSKSLELFTISGSIAHSLKYACVDEVRSKKMVFPIAEEQPYFGMGPRKHWVTLHYDPINQTATVIDSRPWHISYWYSLDAMKNELQAGLDQLGLKVEKIEQYCQNVQSDNIHCGAWTACNVMKFANGMSVADSAQARDLPSKEALIDENIRLAEQLKHESSNYLSMAKELEMDAALQAFMDEDDNTEGDDFGLSDDEVLMVAAVEKGSNNSLSSFRGGTETPDGIATSYHSVEVEQDAVDVAFSEHNQSRWLDETREAFLQAMHSPEQQLQLILDRKSIRYEGRHLASCLTKNKDASYRLGEEVFNVDHMLDELQTKYKGSENASCVEGTQGFTFSPHGHPHPNLEDLGIAQDMLNLMSLKEAIIYESLAYTLQSKEEPSHLAASFLPTSDEEQSPEKEALFEKAQSACNTFLAGLKSCIKDLIVEDHQNNQNMRLSTLILETADESLVSSVASLAGASHPTSHGLFAGSSSDSDDDLNFKDPLEFNRDPEMVQKEQQVQVLQAELQKTQQTYATQLKQKYDEVLALEAALEHRTKTHQETLGALREELDQARRDQQIAESSAATLQEEMQTQQANHAAQIEQMQQRHERALVEARAPLQEHVETIKQLKAEQQTLRGMHAASLSELKILHQQQLATITFEREASLEKIKRLEADQESLYQSNQANMVELRRLQEQALSEVQADGDGKNVRIQTLEQQLRDQQVLTVRIQQLEAELAPALEREQQLRQALTAAERLTQELQAAHQQSVSGSQQQLLQQGLERDSALQEREQAQKFAEELQQRLEAEKEKNAQAMMSAEELLGRSGAVLQQSLATMTQQRDELMEQISTLSQVAQQSDSQTQTNAQPLANISWNVMHGFMMALGAAIVAVAVTALILGGAGILPAAVAITGGTLLAAVGLFGLTKSNDVPSENREVAQLNL